METVAFFTSPPSSCRLDSWGEAKRSFRKQLLQIAKESKQIYRHSLDTCKSFLHAHLKPGSQKFISTVASYSPPTTESKKIFRYTLDKYRSFLNAHLISESQKFSSTIISYSPPTMGKWTGYYLLFFPTLAFCIVYMLKAFQARDHKLLKQQRGETSNVSQARSSRWHKILDDEAVTDPCDTISTEELSNPSEEDQKLPFEELCSAYTKLEPTYMKFLADCGMSKWGYWRGGAPD